MNSSALRSEGVRATDRRSDLLSVSAMLTRPVSGKLWKAVNSPPQAYYNQGDILSTADPAREFGERLSGVLEERDLTQSSLAEIAQTSQATVWKWLKGKALPEGKYLLRLAIGLRLNAHWLLTGKGSEQLPGDATTGIDQQALGAQIALAEVERAVQAIRARIKQASSKGGAGAISNVEELERQIEEEEEIIEQAAARKVAEPKAGYHPSPSKRPRRVGGS